MSEGNAAAGGDAGDAASDIPDGLADSAHPPSDIIVMTPITSVATNLSFVSYSKGTITVSAFRITEDQPFDG